mgnify:CR=1 FL=1
MWDAVGKREGQGSVCLWALTAQRDLAASPKVPGTSKFAMFENVSLYYQK